MTLDIILVQLITGIAYGMLYFMIAAGLTIILGVMNVVNLSHGALFMLGSYLAFTFINNGINFWIALLLSAISVGIFGIILEKVLIKRVYGKVLEQVLLTFGLSPSYCGLCQMDLGNRNANDSSTCNAWIRPSRLGIWHSQFFVYLWYLLVVY